MKSEKPSLYCSLFYLTWRFVALGIARVSWFSKDTQKKKKENL